MRDVIVVTADRRVYVLKDDSEVTVDVTNLLDVSDTAKVTYKFAI
ncbi:hypothetical protein [Bifidobacterium catenulatum]|nr:hypothetical protein [Bifidobacterium catenulatum]